MKLLKKVLSSLPFAPVFFAIWPVLNLYAQNIDELEKKIMVFPLLISTFFAISAFVIFWLVFKNLRKGLVAASCFILLFFSYGWATSKIPALNAHINNFHIGKNFIILPVYFISIISLLFFIKKTKHDLNNLLKFFLVVSVLVIAFPSWQIINDQINHRFYPAIKSPLNIPKPKISLAKNEWPDIYVLMPEDYSAPWVYKQYFKFDNGQIVNYLNSKGFYIPNKSTSNYPKTFLSLSSMFNMEYVNYLSVYKNSSDQTIVNPLIENNNVVRFLKSIGYHYFQLGSWWEPTKKNRLAENLTLNGKNPFFTSQFNYSYISQTLAFPFLTKFFPKTVSDDFNLVSRNDTLEQFSVLKKITKEESPKLVFAHIISPHDPYVFDENCNFTEEAIVAKKTEAENYVSQTACINQKLEQTIDTILTNYKRPSVILLQTDEGAPFLNRTLNPADNWQEAGTKLLIEKFPILSAYYFPDHNYSSLNPSITPVNSFRVILNKYFNTNLPALPDKNYIFPNINDIYNFKDVTDIVQGNIGNPH